MWHGIAMDMRAWARGCIGCQTAKVHRHSRAPLHKFERPNAQFIHVHVDLVGPLPYLRGHTHLLTVIDRFKRWPKAIPLAQTEHSLDRKSFLRYIGSPNLANLRVSHRIGGHSSPRRSGELSQNLWGSRFITPRHTIPRRTDSSKGSTYH